MWYTRIIRTKCESYMYVRTHVYTLSYTYIQVQTPSRIHLRNILLRCIHVCNCMCTLSPLHLTAHQPLGLPLVHIQEGARTCVHKQTCCYPLLPGVISLMYRATIFIGTVIHEASSSSFSSPLPSVGRSCTFTEIRERMSTTISICISYSDL